MDFSAKWGHKLEAGRVTEDHFWNKKLPNFLLVCHFEGDHAIVEIGRIVHILSTSGREDGYN